jgi:hypothetical protein
MSGCPAFSRATALPRLREELWIAIVQISATTSAGLQDCFADFVQVP